MRNGWGCDVSALDLSSRKVKLDASTCEFKCPGCGQIHVLDIDAHAKPPRWVFTGDAGNPTLTPSILARGMLCVYDETGEWTGEWQRSTDGKPIPFVCHSFVRDGRIEFLSDCTHALAGQTIDLPALSVEGLS